MSSPYYLETSQKLAIRIRAHTEFSTSQIEDWLKAELGNASGRRLLEIGCGDGNYFSVYESVLGHRGLIVGMDLNRRLLETASQRLQQGKTPGLVFRWDYDDHPYPLLDRDFDFLVAPFSAYYTRNVSSWIEDTIRVLRKGGRMFLLGPTKENARELYQLNEIVTSVQQIPETEETSIKLEEEFLPLLNARQDVNVDHMVLEREIVFPSAEEYARYYCSTGLYEKTLEKTGLRPSFQDISSAAATTTLRVNKRVLCIRVIRR
jgi:ubiquinone/menaquinone biosynthesis C-methylase UbiE